IATDTRPAGDDKVVDPQPPHDPRLRGVKETLGYELRSGEEVIGVVDDWIVDTEMWTLPFVLLKIGSDEDARKLLVPSDQIKRPGPPERTIELSLPFAMLSTAPAYDEAVGADRQYIEMVSGYYHRAA